jgi:hypothetical protein
VVADNLATLTFQDEYKRESIGYYSLPNDIAAMDISPPMKGKEDESNTLKAKDKKG